MNKRKTPLLLIFTLLYAAHSIAATGSANEKVKGIGVGIDLQSTGSNPLPAVGALWASFGIISYQARATYSYRPIDQTSFMRGGVGLGFTAILLNVEVTYQTGDQRSLGMFWGVSAFASGAALTPEIFAGYQTNFASGADNYAVIGLKGYLNFAEIR